MALDSSSPCACDVIVVIKGEASTYRKKFLNYELINVSLDDKTLQGYVEEALTDCKVSADDNLEINVQIKIVWQ